MISNNIILYCALVGLLVANTVSAVDTSSGIDRGTTGDFKAWNGEHYDYNGLCDLVLLENHGFQDDVGMDIHIRTKQISDWSYISNAVLRIGEDTLEVIGQKNGNSRYLINGREGIALLKRSGSIVRLESNLSGYPITVERQNDELKNEFVSEFTVDLGNNELIVIKTWNHLVQVDILGAMMEHFGSSRGLMGKFPTGEHLARDNVMELKDVNAFGQEWQVQLYEPKLFHALEGAQAPKLCQAPTSSSSAGAMIDTRRQRQRRLGESVISQQKAEIACSHVDPAADRDLCIFDVMATNDLDMAGAY